MLGRVRRNTPPPLAALRHRHTASTTAKLDLGTRLPISKSSPLVLTLVVIASSSRSQGRKEIVDGRYDDVDGQLGAPQSSKACDCCCYEEEVQTRMLPFFPMHICARIYVAAVVVAIIQLVAGDSRDYKEYEVVLIMPNSSPHALDRVAEPLHEAQVLRMNIAGPRASSSRT